MFKIVKEPVALWPVKWAGVAEDGSVIEQSIEMKLARVGRKEFNRIFASDEEVSPEQELDNVVRLVKGWEPFKLDDEVLSHSRESIAELLDLAGFAQGFTLSYIAYWSGRREKNSGPSPAGQAAAAPRTGVAAAASESA
jgi:hypothetical protein